MQRQSRGLFYIGCLGLAPDNGWQGQYWPALLKAQEREQIDVPSAGRERGVQTILHKERTRAVFKRQEPRFRLRFECAMKLNSVKRDVLWVNLRERSDRLKRNGLNAWGRLNGSNVRRGADPKHNSNRLARRIVGYVDDSGDRNVAIYQLLAVDP